ncbi:hypothetical protein BKA61DRAFT_621909 [Leptodontidium sp. MPI-SDFR-AT-0119]|nr:hypothetical protein BKA61DRAFT_621909 [Leptodontidium sp. MPI-SDFR-AT-0119]
MVYRSDSMDLSTEISNLQINAQEEDADSNTPAETTLFPKISGKVPELVRNYVYAHRNPPASPDDKIVTIAPGTPNLVSMTGTVKLHGTHADIVVYHDNTIRLQSRNRLSLDAEMDNYGVAGHLLPWRVSMLALRDRILARFKELNPTSEVLEEHPVIIAGEWVGPGVQKGVALAKLKSKYFVVISIAINNKWVPDEPYSDIEDIEAGIVHVSRGGFFHEVLNIDDPGPCQQKMMDLTLAVEKECPFSKSFGISGVGEGIVWKAAHPLGDDARFWLKTKGPLHRVSNTDDLKKVPPNANEREKAKTFAEAAVTDMRLQQGWDYLGEMRIERNAKAVPRMMKWVCDDVMLEEKDVIEELGVDRQALRKAIGSISRDWFLQKLMGDYTK